MDINDFRNVTRGITQRNKTLQKAFQDNPPNIDLFSNLIMEPPDIKVVAWEETGAGKAVIRTADATEQSAATLDELTDKINQLTDNLESERLLRQAADAENMKYTKKYNTIMLVLGIIGIIVAIASIAISCFIAGRSSAMQEPNKVAYTESQSE